MANSNFVVHNGLTVGQTTVWAGNGDVQISGNLLVAGTTTIVGNTQMTNVAVTVQETIAGALDATIADATALSIALGG